jgi:hypothetical protein
MKTFLACLGVAAFVLLGGCALFGGDREITPAEGMLLGCQAYLASLKTVFEFEKAGLVNEDTSEIVDGVQETTDPLCLGPAPDVNAKVKDIAIDAGAKILEGVVKSIAGGG